MPVLDGNFEAFVTNLGKYNEGELVGEWVKFPTTEEEMKKVFERIGIGSADEFGAVYEEWFITDFECPGYTNLPKGENCKLVMERNGFTSAVYVGDTQGDADAAAFAGIPFVYCAYGFGTPETYDYKIEKFPELLDLF